MQMLTPLTKMFCPFTHAASGLAKKATTGAISSTVPIRFSGCMFAKAAMTCSGFPSRNSEVSTGPGTHHMWVNEEQDIRVRITTYLVKLC